METWFAIAEMWWVTAETFCISRCIHCASCRLRALNYGSASHLENQTLAEGDLLAIRHVRKLKRILRPLYTLLESSERLFLEHRSDGTPELSFLDLGFHVDE